MARNSAGLRLFGQRGIEEKRQLALKSDQGDGCGRSQRNRILLALWAVVLAVIVATLCGRIEDAYLKNRPFFYDPLSYIYANCVLHERVLHEGRWAVIASELRDGWTPLRTVPLLLLSPKALGMKEAHLFTAAPSLALFLVLLGWMVEKRSGSLALSAAAMIFCCAVKGFYDPHWGMGAYWLDLTGGFLIAAAACCLGLSEGGRRSLGLSHLEPLELSGVGQTGDGSLFVHCLRTNPRSGDH